MQMSRYNYIVAGHDFLRMEWHAALRLTALAAVENEIGFLRARIPRHWILLVQYTIPSGVAQASAPEQAD